MDTLAGAVLQAAAAQGYPRLKYKKGHTILAGAEHWGKFVTWMPPEDLHLARAALQTQETRNAGPKPVTGTETRNRDRNP